MWVTTWSVSALSSTRRNWLCGLLQKTDMRRHDVVAGLVARLYRNELQRQINQLHPTDIAPLLETLRTDVHRFLWDLVDSFPTRCRNSRIHPLLDL